jgi:hypothetical protein
MTHPLEASWPLVVSTQPGRDWPHVHARAGRSSVEFAVLLPVRLQQDGSYRVVDHKGEPDAGDFGARVHLPLPEASEDGVRYLDHELVACESFGPERCDAVAVLFVGPARFRAAPLADAKPPDDEKALCTALERATQRIPFSALARWSVEAPGGPAS